MVGEDRLSMFQVLLDRCHILGKQSRVDFGGDQSSKHDYVWEDQGLIGSEHISCYHTLVDKSSKHNHDHHSM